MAGKKKAEKYLKEHKKTLKVSKKLKIKKKVLKIPKKPEKAAKPEKTKPAAAPKAAAANPIDAKVNETVEKIRTMQVQGANDVAEAGVRALKYVAENSDATNRKDFLEHLTSAAEKLKTARPTEPALRNAVNSIVSSTECYELKSMDNVRRYAVRQADRLLKLLEEVVATIANIGSEEIRDGDVILTHCHSEHVVAILKKAKEKRKQFRVIVTETRPLNQGLRTAKELSESGIDITYIIDAAVATVMKEATKVLIGCDAILADGSIVNKIGTYTMALVARQFQTPVFVAAETLKFDPVTVMGVTEPIEQRKPEEIANPQDMKKVKIVNLAFDVTPAELIDAIITEKGVMRPELVRENVRLV